MSTLVKSPIIIETDRGPTISGTRITVFSIMDSLKSGHSHNSIRELFFISDEQLDAVLKYISDHREAIESEYAEIVRRSEQRRATYERVFRMLSPLPADLPPDERRARLRQRLLKKQASSFSQNENRDTSRS